MGTSDKIKELEKKLKKVSEGDQVRIDKQHKAGKMAARERINALLDADSFVELDAMVKHRSNNFGLEKKRPDGDGVVMATVQLMEEQSIFLHRILQYSEAH